MHRPRRLSVRPRPWLVCFVATTGRCMRMENARDQAVSPCTSIIVVANKSSKLSRQPGTRSWAPDYITVMAVPLWEPLMPGPHTGHFNISACTVCFPTGCSQLSGWRAYGKCGQGAVGPNGGASLPLLWGQGHQTPPLL